MYHHLALTPTGFVQQLVTNYLANGFFFYVLGHIGDERKDPARTDEKILAKYRVAVSATERQRRKAAGRANLHYLRHGRVFLILATAGEHEFFEAERNNVRDVREHPIKVFGYSIRVVKGQFLKTERPGDAPRRDTKRRVRVQIGRERFLDLKAGFLAKALSRTAEELVADFQATPYQPYAPVRRQLLEILRHVNRTREASGLPAVPVSALRLRRQIVFPFGKGNSRRPG
ncbi:MAG: hypothetical protein K2X82_20275 [Gemmataceae bacterium]|nr:hypothetical protein [Gemmataceae bacterium]